MQEGAVLVTGATGLIGRKLVDGLLHEGFPVRALSRSASRAGLPEEVDAIDWNGRNAPPEALFRCHAVVHLAGEPVFGGRMTEVRKRRIRESRIASTRALAEALTALPQSDRPEAFVCASAVGYYGARGDELLDEKQAPGEGFLAEVCSDWEEAAGGVETAGIRHVSLRFGIVLSRDGGALVPMLLPFRLGLGAKLGDGEQWFPWVHVDDAVGIALDAIRKPAYRGAVNVVAPNPVTNAEFTRSLAAALGRPAFLRIPKFVLGLAGPEISAELLGSRRGEPRAALDNGFAFAYPEISEALAAEV